MSIDQRARNFFVPLYFSWTVTLKLITLTLGLLHAAASILNAFIQLVTFTLLLICATAHICFLAILVQCLNIMHVKRLSGNFVLTLDQEAEEDSH